MLDPSCVHNLSKVVIEITNLIREKVTSNPQPWTHDIFDRISQTVQGFSKSDTYYFIHNLMVLFLDPKTCIQNRFKITQILSILHSKSLPYFAEIILPFKEQVFEIINEDSTQSLNQAMKQHFLSIYKVHSI